MSTRTIENIAYDLRIGIVDDVQNRSETTIWGGGGGGSFVNGHGSFDPVTINSQTEHWKQVRISWEDGGRSSVDLPGHVSAVAGDEVGVLFASIPGVRTIGAAGFHNRAERHLWWWSVGERILSDRDLADSYVPKHSRKKRYSIGFPLTSLLAVLGAPLVLLGMTNGLGWVFLVGLGLCALFGAVWAMFSGAQAREVRFTRRLERLAETLIQNFDAAPSEAGSVKPTTEQAKRRAVAQA